MPNALRTTRQGFIVGQAFIALGRSVKQAVHDGDTVSVSPNTRLNTRLLGVDTPEVSFSLPGETTYLLIGGDRWVEFLDDPFAADLPVFQPALPAALEAHSRAATGTGRAANHHLHARAAEAALQDLIIADVEDAGLSPAEADTFGLFLAFGRDVIDRYGRLLAYLHRDDPAGRPGRRRALLHLAQHRPLPPRPDRAPTRPPVHHARLDTARTAVADARRNQLGIFAAADPLRLLPFELRSLARTTRGAQPTRPGPDRWIIDLANQPGTSSHPTATSTSPDPQDRLFVDPADVPVRPGGGPW